MVYFLLINVYALHKSTFHCLFFTLFLNHLLMTNLRFKKFRLFWTIYYSGIFYFIFFFESFLAFLMQINLDAILSSWIYYLGNFIIQ